jgi:serine/threonine-protein kinase
MAEVYVASRQGPHGFQKTVAVKRILPQLVQDPEFVAMFVDEARVAATLSHPNIVQVFDFGEQDGELYMAMEYVKGTNVARLIRRAAAQGEIIPLDVCMHIVLSVLRGLEYAHGARDESGELLRLVHRDVSPGNVLIDDSGAVKLTDFGIARAATFERRTAVGHMKGKLGYMSPEQVTGLDLDARSDLFTLGIVFAELVTLRPLFTARTELEVLTRIRDADLGDLEGGSLPPDVHAVLRRALARNPDSRFPDAHTFAEAVESLARHRGFSLGAPRLSSWMARLERASMVVPEPPPQIHDANTSILPEQALVGDWEDERVTPPLSTYRLKLGDGSVVGPLRYHDVAELFATGRAGSASLVARDEGEFEPARSFPELQRFVTSSALLLDNAESWSVRPRRAVDRAAIPRWLFRLAVTKKTGAILLRDTGRRKAIFLVDGVPEFATSTDKRELLGEHLIAEGKVLRSDVEMALSILPRFGGRLGDALVGLGVLRPVELFRAIHEQTIQRYLELFRWQDGQIAFEAGAVSGEETLPLGVDPIELVARGVRQTYSTDEIGRFLASMRDVPVAPAPHPLLRIDALRWTPGEAKVLGELLVPRPLASFLLEQREQQEAPWDDVVRGVFLGLSFGVLVSPAFDALDVLD